MNNQPERTAKHEALEVFLCRWSARGTSYGATDQSGDDPKANGEAWVSTHEARWHTGRFFLVQDERADIAGSRFDTVSILGVGDDGDYSSRGFENHKFFRHYAVSRDGETWRIEGPSERATVVLENNGRRQVWAWNGSLARIGFPCATGPRNASTRSLRHYLPFASAFPKPKGGREATGLFQIDRVRAELAPGNVIRSAPTG